MDDDYSFVFAILGIFIGLGMVFGLFGVLGHYTNLDILACYEVVKDKSASEMLMLCKGPR